MVWDGFRRLLSGSGFQIVAQKLESMIASNLRNFEVARASVHIIDALTRRHA